ncbi:PqqD family protein [Candidatus Methylomirabilis sp.]|uniref:PqqD family protein n=1 Tax=Candidatus Methylomirabilis sp. TaxID=2032687 RepID=UPI002A5F00A6|nr:PqqD family protein [Candidatus Methylomirabilis sp.]
MSQQVSLTSSVRIRDDVLSRDLQSEQVILDLNTGIYFGLDPVGTRIWQLIQEHQSLQKVLDSMLEEYEVAEAECTHDLLHFVTQMADRGLVEVYNDGSS